MIGEVCKHEWGDSFHDVNATYWCMKKCGFKIDIPSELNWFIHLGGMKSAQEKLIEKITKDEQEFHILNNEKFLKINGAETTAGQLWGFEAGIKYTIELIQNSKMDADYGKI